MRDAASRIARSGSALIVLFVGWEFVAELAGVFLSTKRAEGTEKGGGNREGEDAGGLSGASMEHYSMDLNYCQGTVLSVDDSN